MCSVYSQVWWVHVFGVLESFTGAWLGQFLLQSVGKQSLLVLPYCSETINQCQGWCYIIAMSMGLCWVSFVLKFPFGRIDHCLRDLNVKYLRLLMNVIPVEIPNTVWCGLVAHLTKHRWHRNGNSICAWVQIPLKSRTYNVWIISVRIFWTGMSWTFVWEAFCILRCHFSPSVALWCADCDPPPKKTLGSCHLSSYRSIAEK